MSTWAPPGSEQPEHVTDSRRGGRRLAAVGLTAGLLGGGAIGLIATMPSITSAAADEGAAVALQDDPTDETGAATVTDEDTDERPDRAERLRDALQPLVDDGTITAAQADAVATYLDERAPGRPDRRGGPGHGHRHGLPGADGEVVAGVIGIDVETLREELRSGSSIAEIAEANGVDTQTVIDALVDEAQAHLDLAVESGRLTEDEAAERAADIEERVTDRINGEGPFSD